MKLRLKIARFLAPIKVEFHEIPVKLEAPKVIEVETELK